MRPIRGTNLLIKSVGYGVMLADLLAPEEANSPQNGAIAERAKILDKMARESGLAVQEVLADPADASKAVLISSEGHAPGQFEKSQTQAEDWERLQRTLEVSRSQRLSERLDWIRNA